MERVGLGEDVNKIINDDLIRTIKLDILNSDMDKYFNASFIHHIARDCYCN